MPCIFGLPDLTSSGSSGRKRERARVRETRVSPSRAPIFSCAHYFQAPSTQATVEVVCLASCPNAN